MKERQTVLITPLDWGLGHATRCVPIIEQFLHSGHEVIIGASGASATLLQNIFPNCEHIPMPEFTVTYSKTGKYFPIKALLQIPKFKRQISRDKKKINEIVASRHIDLILSDNRWGCYHHQIHSVFITHQLAVKTGLGTWFDNKAMKVNYKMINRFSECWVPDLPGEKNIAGELSHPSLMPNIPVKYIGLLSAIKNNNQTPEKDSVLILLSGPEPQRSILEDIINKQMSNFTYCRMVFVRGLPKGGKKIEQWPHVAYHDYLSGQQLEEMFNRSEVIVCRSGYSSIMDILNNQKKAVCIPTPGQTEQEYLAKRMAENGWAVCTPQNGFSLKSTLKETAELPPLPFFINETIDLVGMINSKK